MVQRLTYRKHIRYNTKGNKQRKVKTPGGRLVFQQLKKKASPPLCGDCGKALIGIPCLRPKEYRLLKSREKRVNRAYGGSRCASCVRSRVMRAFLIEEQKCVKQVLAEKMSQSKEKAGPAIGACTVVVVREGWYGKLIPSSQLKRSRADHLLGPLRDLLQAVWCGREQDPEGAGLAPQERVLPRRERALDLPNAVCVLVENYFTIDECERYMALLQSELDWKRQQIAVRPKDDQEKVVAEPRMTLFMSDPGICYEYSGRGWQPFVLAIKQSAERFVVECGQPPVTFNSVQFNRYNGPRHTLGMHADDEPFAIKRRNTTDEEKVVELADGSILLMGGAMQSHYLHGVPPGGQTGLRFNLTFRVCIPRESRTEAGRVLVDQGRRRPPPGAPPEVGAELRRFAEENGLDERCLAVLQLGCRQRGRITEARNTSAMALTRLQEARAQIAAAAKAGGAKGRGAGRGAPSGLPEGGAPEASVAKGRGAELGPRAPPEGGAPEARSAKGKGAGSGFQRFSRHRADVEAQSGRPPGRAA
ncbi:unnamed protein product [Prorocentrum cordatum]|uniref:Fe2OG dioxygenase domain-containing protein n=1 Tax=Prorocentrum cordatum TaxID=2364126 RepID=A0ABN9TMQ6_9DINO|nr:unnamed protein product [Polarella glacialis]